MHPSPTFKNYQLTANLVSSMLTPIASSPIIVRQYNNWIIVRQVTDIVLFYL